MRPDDNSNTARRRRGAELEEALLDAAWEVLQDSGYAGFTLEAVAGRAGTSRPVIARRWSGRHELLRATIAHLGAGAPTPVPDTGSLRGDLLALMRALNHGRMDVAAVLGAQLGGYYQETGESLFDLRDVLLGKEDPVLDRIFDAAVERGEADPGRATGRIRSLPLDLLRHHVFLTFGPMPDDGLVEIVDTIVLPLVTPGA